MDHLITLAEAVWRGQAAAAGSDDESSGDSDGDDDDGSPQSSQKQSGRTVPSCSASTSRTTQQKPQAIRAPAGVSGASASRTQPSAGEQTIAALQKQQGWTREQATKYQLKQQAGSQSQQAVPVPSTSNKGRSIARPASPEDEDTDSDTDDEDSDVDE